MKYRQNTKGDILYGPPVSELLSNPTICLLFLDSFCSISSVYFHDISIDLECLVIMKKKNSIK